MRTLITGGPRTGKTTLAATIALRLDVIAQHTDDIVARFDWSGASAEVATWFDAPGPWVIEGVAIPRAIRKWLAAHPHGKPCDVVLVLEEPRVRLTTFQETMTKGVVTVWRSVIPELERRGVQITKGG